MKLPTSVSEIPQHSDRTVVQAHSAAVLPGGGLSPSVFWNTLNCPSNVVLLSELHMVYAPSHEMLCKTLYNSATNSYS